MRRQPGRELGVPELAVAWLEHPVVLVGKPQQPRIDTARLERVVVGQTVAVRHAVVLGAVDHQRGRVHVRGRSMRALGQHTRHVVPVGGRQVARAHGITVGTEAGHAVKDTGVADIGLVATFWHMAVHPGHQEAAVTAAGGKHPPGVGPGLLEQPVGGGFDVQQLQLALAADQAVAEAPAKAAGAVVVDLRDDVAGGSKDMRVPAVAEAVARGRVRAAVDDVGERVFALGVKAGREGQPHLHRRAAGTLDLDLFDLAQAHAVQQLVVEALQPPRRGAGAQGQHTPRVQGRVGGDHHHLGPNVKALHAATGVHDLDGAAGQRVAPEVAATALFGGETDGAAVGRPEQRAAHVMVPVRAQRAPAAPLQIHDGQLAKRRVHPAGVRGHGCQLAPIRAVARRAKVPGRVAGQRLEFSAAQAQLGQTAVVAQALLCCRVVRKGDALAARVHVVGGVAAGLPRQFIGRAFEEIGDAPTGQVQQQQVQHAVLRQVVIPEAVVGLAGGVARFLALGPGLVGLVLRRRALELGPHPCGKEDAFAIRHPLEGFDAGRKVAHARGLAAVGRDHVELRAGVLAALLFTPRHEGDAVALRRPRCLPVLAATPGQPARRAAQRGQQPQRGAAAVVGHREAGDRAHGTCAVGGQRQAADALKLPEGVGVERLGFCHATSVAHPVFRASRGGRSPVPPWRRWGRR